jgi:hypothetical protein
MSSDRVLAPKPSPDAMPAPMATMFLRAGDELAAVDVVGGVQLTEAVEHAAEAPGHRGHGQAGAVARGPKEPEEIHLRVLHGELLVAGDVVPELAGDAAQRLGGDGDDEAAGVPRRLLEVGGGPDPLGDDVLREVAVVGVVLVDLAGAVGVAHPQERVVAVSTQEVGQSRPPGAAAEDGGAFVAPAHSVPSGSVKIRSRP